MTKQPIASFLWTTGIHIHIIFHSLSFPFIRKHASQSFFFFVSTNYMDFYLKWKSMSPKNYKYKNENLVIPLLFFYSYPGFQYVLFVHLIIFTYSSIFFTCHNRERFWCHHCSKFKHVFSLLTCVAILISLLCWNLCEFVSSIILQKMVNVTNILLTTFFMSYTFSTCHTLNSICFFCSSAVCLLWVQFFFLMEKHWHLTPLIYINYLIHSRYRFVIVTTLHLLSPYTLNFLTC